MSVKETVVWTLDRSASKEGQAALPPAQDGREVCLQGQEEEPSVDEQGVHGGLEVRARTRMPQPLAEGATECLSV